MKIQLHIHEIHVLVSSRVGDPPAMAGALLPMGGIFMMEKGSKARKYLAQYAAIIGLSGLGYIALGLILDIVVEPLLYTFILGIFFYGWVTNYLIMKSAKEY